MTWRIRHGQVNGHWFLQPSYLRLYSKTIISIALVAYLHATWLEWCQKDA